MSQCKPGICCRQTPHPRNSSTNHWPQLRHRSLHRKTKFKAKRQNLSFSFSVFAPVCAFSVRVKPSRQSRVPTWRRQRFHKGFQISVHSALGWEETVSRKVGNVGFAKKQSFPNATAETSFKICVYAWAQLGVDAVEAVKKTLTHKNTSILNLRHRGWVSRVSSQQGRQHMGGNRTKSKGSMKDKTI